MSDYIRRQDAIRWVKTECNPYGKPTLDFESGKKVFEHLEQMPPADVAPVVRCKDCIHNNDCDIQYSAQAGENFFCSYGERREE